MKKTQIGMKVYFVVIIFVLLAKSTPEESSNSKIID